MSKSLNERFLGTKQTVELSVAEINKIIELLDRDEPKPIVKDGHDAWNEGEKKYACSACGRRVYDDENFCKWCGQRFDTQNYGL